MDAYKSMYGNKEEVINEMKMGDVSGSADFASRNIKDAKGAAPTPKPTPTAVDKPKSKTETDNDKLLKLFWIFVELTVTSLSETVSETMLLSCEWEK